MKLRRVTHQTYQFQRLSQGQTDNSRANYNDLRHGRKLTSEGLKSTDGRLTVACSGSKKADRRRAAKPIIRSALD